MRLPSARLKNGKHIRITRSMAAIVERSRKHTRGSTTWRSSGPSDSWKSVLRSMGQEDDRAPWALGGSKCDRMCRWTRGATAR
eukprot:scaffold22810_cov127-Isochrysis_galbana.AAC.4